MLTDIALRVNVIVCSKYLGEHANKFFLCFFFFGDVRCPGCIGAESDSKIFTLFSKIVLLTSTGDEGRVGVGFLQ